MSTPAQTLTVRVPFTIRKRGGRKLVIAADGSTLASPRPFIDNTLVKALARAHRWNRLLETGRYSSARSVRPFTAGRRRRAAGLHPAKGSHPIGSCAIP